MLPHIHPENADTPFLKPKKSQNASNRRGFPRAVRAEKPVNISFFHGQGQMTDAPVLSVIFGHILNGYCIFLSAHFTVPPYPVCS